MSENEQPAPATPTERPLPPLENKGMTGAEQTAWWGVGIGVAIFLIALLTFSTVSGHYDADTAAPSAWMFIGAGIAGFMLVPAILLTGIRSLLPDRRFATK